MTDPKKSDEQNLQLLLKNSGFFVHREPEWCKKISGSNFKADFLVLNKNILISRPSGHANLSGIEQSAVISQKVSHRGIEKDTLYIQIEDYSRLRGASLDARKFFINYFKNQKYLKSIIFCNTSALFNLSIKLGRRIYPFDFDIHLAKDLKQAIAMAQNTLSKNNLLPEKDSPHIQSQGNNISITCKNEWMLNLDDYKMRFELINDDILHPVPSGSIRIFKN